MGTLQLRAASDTRPLVDHAESERAILNKHGGSPAKAPPTSQRRTNSKRKGGKKGTRGAQAETSTEPGGIHPIHTNRRKISLRAPAHACCVRPPPRPSPALRGFDRTSARGRSAPADGPGSRSIHGAGLRAVGVGSALPRRRVRAGFRRQGQPIPGNGHPGRKFRGRVGNLRMEGVYRLLLHEKKVIQDGTSDAKLHAPIHYERDVTTALGTTKWQLEQFEREVNAAAFSDKSNSRENAILKFRQFIRAIAEQISEVEESLKNLRTDFSRTPRYPYSSEQDGDGLASFLSGSKNDSRPYFSTDTDEITELKIDSAPMVNGYHSSQDHKACDFKYSGNDVEGASKLLCSCGGSACEGDHNDNSLCNLDADDSVGRSHRSESKLSRQCRSFMRNLWYTKRGRESFTKRRKDGEVMDGLRNGNILPPFSLPTSGRGRYCWPELIKRRLSRSYYNRPQVCIATSLLVALAVLGLLVLHAR